jgi:valyl-tRNA synthetase
MEKTYNPALVESKIYRMWEKGGYFIPRQARDKLPFTIILPPPNANAPLHMGHAMYTIEDIMIRYHRMKGDTALWLPGADHAGFETQFVFEKFLAKQGKSRFDYDHDTLYTMIWDFVEKNRGMMESQLKRLGFSLDWSRLLFTLDPAIVKIVHTTFKKLHDDTLVYRDFRLVNYCTKCGTGFSDLEVKHGEQNAPLYYMKYGPFTLASVRPETKFGDTAVAVHPKDKRYTDWIGKKITFDGLLGPVTLQVIADEAVDPEFGTGVVKVTPAHDPTDYEIGKRHHLPMKQVIGFDGKLTSLAGVYAGFRVKAARAKVVEDLQAKGLIEKIDTTYVHTVGTCYRCGTILEPLPMTQWFIKVRPLADTAIKTIKGKKIVFVPKRFEKQAVQWLTDFHDWNISRQVVWGIRIPAWKCTHCSHDIKNINDGWIVTDGKKPEKCPKCQSADLLQETDTFDTWFSSGQWPFATLKSCSKSDFEYFYPTSVMETGYDILPWWVCRMIMLGIYATSDVPFKTVYLHGLVRDTKGQKMSKSKGNIVNPIDMVEKYGADALRMTLVFGTTAGNDQSLSEDKIRGMRNFANKLWNIARLFLMNMESANIKELPFYDKKMYKSLPEGDKQILNDLNQLIKDVTRGIEKYRFSDAAQKIYEFAWHEFADNYLEENKEQFKNGDIQALSVFRHVLLNVLKLLHPFMPFITEEIWGMMPRKTKDPLIISSWPK